MATTRRRKAAKRPRAKTKNDVLTRTLLGVRRAMSEGKDIILVSRTLKRPEVRVRHDGLNRLYEIDRFVFLAYRPNSHSVWYHVFVDGEYIGIDRSRLEAAMIEAVAHAALSVTDPDGVKQRANVACDVLRFANR